MDSVKQKKITRRKYWIFAGAFFLSLTLLEPIFPGIFESLYSNGIFIGVRYSLDFIFGWYSFSIFYFLTILFMFWFSWKFAKWIHFMRTDKTTTSKERRVYSLISIGAFISQFIMVYLFLFGYNLLRIPIDEKLGLNTSLLSEQEIIIETHRVRKMAIESRREITALGIKDFNYSILPMDMESSIKNDLKNVLKSMGYKVYGNPPVKYINPDGILNTLGVSGYYNPFIGEVHMDRNFSPLFMPFLLAHELAHAFGFPDEGEANFLGYVACEASSNPIIKYSGRITYLLYLTYHIKNIDIKFSKEIYHDLTLNGRIQYQPKYARMILLVKAWRDMQPKVKFKTSNS